MKLDFASLAFGYSVRDSVATPNWATSLGQGVGYKINISDDINQLLSGLIYSSVQLSTIEAKIGKGGRIVSGDSSNTPIILAAMFNKVYINDVLINGGKYILLITKDTSESHKGRLRLKYGPSNTFKTSDETYSNEKFFEMAKNQLLLAKDACFFVSEINVINQNELILKTFIVNKDQSVVYENSDALHNAWSELADFTIDLPKNNENVDLLSNGIIVENSNKDFSIEELGIILRGMYDKAKNKTTAIHIFGLKYGSILKNSEISIQKIVELSTLKDTYDVEISKGIRIYESILNNEFGVSFFDKNQIHAISKNTSKELPEFSSRTQKRYSLNQILYGAPGTGKTYSTSAYAVSIIENKEIHEINRESHHDVMSRYNKLVNDGIIVFTTFHQNYGYEDFIQGIRPDINKEEMSFKMYDGIFKNIVEKAMNQPNKNFVIIIDEINRANISKVFGELITLIEDDKRWGEENAISVTLPSGEIFAVPNNLYIIGTMNSADKSISLIDTALRRRFEFIEFIPDLSLISDIKLREVLKKLNDGIEEHLNSSDLLVGHSYFIGKSMDELADIMNRSIIPLLYEYFFDDKKKVEVQIKKAIENTDYIVKGSIMGRLKVEKKEGH